MLPQKKEIFWLTFDFPQINFSISFFPRMDFGGYFLWDSECGNAINLPGTHLQMGKCSALQRGAVLEDELNPLWFGDLERFHLNNLGGVFTPKLLNRPIIW